MSFFIRITGAKEAQRKLSADAFWSAVKRGMQRGVDRVHEQLPDYPSPPGAGSWAANTTRAQKAAFFAQLRAGGWSHRTGKLGQSIKSEVRGSGAGVTGVIGASMPYAKFVIAYPPARMHFGRWWSLEAQVRQRLPVVKDAIEGEVKKELG